jgi:UDP-N-acetylmuramoyl-tripeptide--D-alanyl-D-alanine ligase
MARMDTLTLEFLIEALTGHRTDGHTPLGDPAIDSRDAGPGALFLALPGEKADGHTYAADALARGAAAALVSRDMDLPYPVIDLRPSAGLPPGPPPGQPVLLRVDDVLAATQAAARQWCRRWLAGGSDRRIIGITGSVGKTTTKELAADVLRQRYPTLRSPKSYNNEIGIPVTVLKLRGEHRRAVLEMSMYVPGEINLLVDIAPPHVGVVTLIAPVHAERAGSLEAIVEAKTELVRALPPGPAGIAILNRDDEHVMGMARHTRADVLTYGLDPGADVWASNVEGMGLDGIHFWIHYRDGHYHVRLPLLGRHSVHTALRAAAVGLVEGVMWEEILTGLQTSRSQLRLLAVQGPRGATIIDDTYNASPPSTIAALNLLHDVMEGRRIAVLGDMLELGAYEVRGHRDVGIRAAEVVDLLVTVGERGRIIAEEAMRRHLPPERVHAMATAQEATGFLLGEIREGDTVLVKGSRAIGMERIVSMLQEAAKSEADPS